MRYLFTEVVQNSRVFHIEKAFYQKSSLFHGVHHRFVFIEIVVIEFRVSLPWLRSVYARSDDVHRENREDF